MSGASFRVGVACLRERLDAPLERLGLADFAERDLNNVANTAFTGIHMRGRSPRAAATFHATRLPVYWAGNFI